MSYASHRSRRRNPKKEKKKSFFSKIKDRLIPPKKPFFQAKLVLGEPDDKFEKEANSVAAKVVNSPNEGAVVQKNAISSVQRYMTNSEFDERGTNTSRIEEDKRGDELPMQSMAEAQQPEEENDLEAGQSMGMEEKPEEMKTGQSMEKEEDKSEVGQSMGMEEKPEEMKTGQSMEKEEDKSEVGQSMGMEEKQEEMKTGQSMEKEEDKSEVGQSMEMDEKEKGGTVGMAMHKKEERNGQKASPDVEALLTKTKGKGSPMSEDLKTIMEERFGTNFDAVRIHTGEDAVRLTEMLNAQAFTQGCDIYFNTGKFNPNTASGLYLIAHELTHVVQQKK